MTVAIFYDVSRDVTMKPHFPVPEAGAINKPRIMYVNETLETRSNVSGLS